MAENSKIEWCHHTFNGWIGCSKVGPGCDNCYAETQDNHRKWTPDGWGPGKPRRRTSDSNWENPPKWDRKAFREGTRYRVFCSSLADVFDNEVPQEWREDLWALIAATPNLDWLILTKRIGNARSMVPPHWMDDGFPRNVWMGATVVNQTEADRDIPKLLRIPASVLWLSMEPLLGPVNLTKVPGWPLEQYADGEPVSCCRSETRVDWVVVGGESGPGARPMHPDWARSLRDQCQAAGVPFLLKQVGHWAWASHIAGPPHISHAVCEHGHTAEFRTDPLRAACSECGSGQWEGLRPVGKTKAGRLLDGRTWDQYPERGQLRRAS